MKIKENGSRIVFNLFNVLFMLLMVVITIYPVLYVVFASVSDPTELMMNQGFLVHPLGFTLEAYKMVFRNNMILRGYINTIIVVVGGVALNIVMTAMGAYFLALKNLMWRNAIMMFIIFTMYFNGGLIPFYFTVKELHLDNSLLALIIPGAISTMNLIIMRTSFAALPESLIESARLDGASHFKILFRIMIPLSLPTVAVMVLYYGVGHWNAWFNATIFITKRERLPLQVILREILLQSETQGMMQGVSSDDSKKVSDLIKYAAIVVATVPILAIYPFLQKYFVKGVLIGSVKG